MASITAISGNGTVVTYTATNTFTAGDKVVIYGATTSAYNSVSINPTYGYVVVATATGTQFTVVSTATGATSTATANLYTLTPDVNDISEEFQVDLTRVTATVPFSPTDAAYDLAINDLPFILRISNQNPYRRETAPYKKEQFDSSNEPGEQALTGWWLRSQTSWHNGAGLTYFEPGIENNVSHRFKDSRGVDIWNIGEVRLLPSVFHAYTGANGINAAVGNNGGTDVLISGDSNGILKRLTLNGNSEVTSDSTVNYVHTGTSYPQGHNGSNFGFTSVTTSGGKYYATCSGAIHRGTVGTLDSDVVFAQHSGGSTSSFVKYAKGFVFFGENNVLNLLDTTQGNTNAHSGNLPAGKQYDSRTHIDSTFVWNDVAGGQTNIYASGNAGNSGEIWKISFDGTPTSTNNGTLLPDLTGSTVNATLPDGEKINAIHHYLGYLIIGTSKGIRICPINVNGDLTLGPLLAETSYSVKGFTERGTYIYAATKANNAGNTNGILIRIDLSQPFEDGTFPYAYDLECESIPHNSDCTEVYNVNDRLVMVIEEGGVAGELQVEHTTNYRSSGWIETGFIRFATVEPKFFKYLNVNSDMGTGDYIHVETIDHSGNYYDITNVTNESTSANVTLNYPTGGQEFIGLRFTLNNASPLSTYPILQSYQLKAIPGSKRQRLIQYPLSCFDRELDRFNSDFGYTGRAYDLLTQLEELESNGDFVSITDYRTNEAYSGIIEEVRFTNESSPDKDNNGFGGTLIITVRKIS